MPRVILDGSGPWIWEEVKDAEGDRRGNGSGRDLDLVDRTGEDDRDREVEE